MVVFFRRDIDNGERESVCTQPRASDFFFSSVERTQVVGYRVLVQVKVEVVSFVARADEINIKGAYALLLQKEGANLRKERTGQLLERTKWGCVLWVPRTVVSLWPKISSQDCPSLAVWEAAYLATGAVNQGIGAKMPIRPAPYYCSQ
jgi:hypothetical protein